MFFKTILTDVVDDNKTFDCDVSVLSQYCVCPSPCPGVRKCPCNFLGTGSKPIGKPFYSNRSNDDVPVPPYCSCPVAKCKPQECPDEIEACTAESIQNLINE